MEIRVDYRERFAGLALWWIGINPPSTVEVTGLRLTQPVKRSNVMETEKGTDNQELEQAAKTAQSDAPSADEPVISEEKAVAKFTALRSRAQTAELRAERAEGVIEGMKQAATKAVPPAKSPLQLRAEQEGVSVGEVQMDGALYEAQRTYDQQIVNQKTATDAKTAKAEIMENSRTAAKAKHADWRDIIAAGEGNLTPGELLDLENAGADFGDKAYEVCKVAIERAKPKTETPAPEKKPGEPETKAETKQEPPSQQEILDAVGPVDPEIATAMEL